MTLHRRPLPCVRLGYRAATLSATACALLLSSQSAQAQSVNVGLTADRDPHTIVGGGLNSGDPSVPLLVAYGENGEQSICTGSLVAKQWILTAAHCVDAASLGFEPAGIEVYFGTEYSQNDPGYLFSTWADGFTYHEAWNTNDMMAGNDIAVIHVEQEVPLPLMPLMDRPLDQADRGAPVRLIGWGITLGDRQDSGVKRHVMSSLFDFDATLVQIGDSSTNVCSGDSGGPAVMSIGGQEVQIGVTSFGDTQCVEIGIDTRVDAFTDWIATATNGEVAPGMTPAAPSDDGGGAGNGCQTDADCDGGVCVSDGQQSLCTSTCAGPDDCPAGLECFATDDPQTNVCWPSEDPGTSPPPPSDDDTDDDDDDDDDDDKDIGDDDDRGGSADDRDEDDAGMTCSVNTNAAPPTTLLALFALVVGRLRRRR